MSTTTSATDVPAMAAKMPNNKSPMTKIAQNSPSARHPVPTRNNQWRTAIDILFSTLVPANPVINRRRHQQEHSSGGNHRAQIEENALEFRGAAESRSQRRSQEKAEQYLRARQRDAKLRQKLDQLPVSLLFPRFRPPAAYPQAARAIPAQDRHVRCCCAAPVSLSSTRARRPAGDPDASGAAKEAAVERAARGGAGELRRDRAVNSPPQFASSRPRTRTTRRSLSATSRNRANPNRLRFLLL